MTTVHQYRVTVDGEEFYRATGPDAGAAFAEAKAEMIRLAETHETVVLERMTADGWQRRAVWSVKLPEDAA